MRLLTILIIFFSGLSCKSLTETEKLHQAVSGKWLIIAPEHDLKEGGQMIAYSHIQDSIIALSGLKLISLSSTGIFQQVDSIYPEGQWGITTDKVVFVEKGGQGFDNFSARFKQYDNGMLQLVQVVEYDGEKIQLTWNLRKVSGKYVSKLFDEDKNEWRKKPVQPETEQQMKRRLAIMLGYYSDYYSLVTKESSFFIPGRVLLPFKFYSHGIGVNPFDEQTFFASLFFDKEQARQGWLLLKTTFNRLKNNFPKRNDFLEEYAAFMNMMAERITEDY